MHVTGLTTNGTVIASVPAGVTHLPAAVNAYYKLIAGNWESFTYDGETGVQVNGNIITVIVRDNGRGDSDPALGQAGD
ncbi:MAG: hypothetical protein WCC60_21455 [Ilumatobacteraceae bacterium]